MLRLNARAVDIIAAILCLVTALSLQIQITLFASPTYLGLRINLTDLLVPFAGMAILATLLSKQSLWPQWQIKQLYKWLTALGALLALALIHTYFTFGEISHWAAINKFGGWFVLLAIMGMGAWVATNARKQHLELFIKVFLYFFLAVAILQLSLIIAVSYPEIKSMIPVNRLFYFPAEGLMANRNAYGLLFAVTLCLASCFYFSENNPVSGRYTIILCLLLPLFLSLNGSRALLIAVHMIVPVLLFIHWDQKKRCLHFMLAILAGFALMYGITHTREEKLIPVHNLQKYEFLIKADDDNSNIAYPGDSMRLTILQDAMEMVRANPVLGSGLGSMLLYQQEKHGKIINLIDCTPLWILVEMGAIGLLIFAAFYFQIAKCFYTSWKNGEGFSKTTQLSLMFILFAFTFTSLFHEIMYTRFIWFFLGIGLALPARMRQV